MLHEQRVHEQAVGNKMGSEFGLLSARYVQGMGYCQQDMFRVWVIVRKRCGRLVVCTGCSI